MIRSMLSISLALACGACSAPAAVPADPVDVGEQRPTAAAVEASPTPATIEAAKAALAREAKIEDLTYDASAVVQWNVGVRDDGSRRVGYAQYVCQVLAEKDALAGRTHVRIVDIAKVAQGSDFRAANLGHVICETGDVVDA